MSAPIELYRPSNPDEGYSFRSQFCDKCQRDNPDDEQYCEILGRTYAYSESDKEYPNQWRFEKGKPVCTAFWPHGMESDPVHVVTDDRTLDMFTDDDAATPAGGKQP